MSAVMTFMPPAAAMPAFDASADPFPDWPEEGNCVTCRWANGDGKRFQCYLRARVTENEGCAAWEREPGAD